MKHDDGLPLHKIAYLYLREMGNNFITRGGDLALSAKPTGTYSWVPLLGDNLSPETPTGTEIDLDIDQHLDEMDPVYISPELNQEEEGFDFGNDRV